MEESIVNKIFKTIKNKISTGNKDNSENLDCAFSFEEINNLEKQNKEKIKELKKNILIKDEKKVSPTKRFIKEEKIEEKKELGSEDITKKESLELSKEKNINEDNEDESPITRVTEVKEEIKQEAKKDIKEEPYDSYINLTKESQDIITKRWQSIDIIKLDEDILKGKDILAHNYTITYGDDALAFIYKIRKDYDVLIEYFIGFNNEKKGILNKNIFSDKLDSEWRYLANYIKLLEKIRGVKK